MAVVVDPAQERRERLRYRLKLIVSLIGLCLSAIALVAVVTVSLTNRSQQEQLAKFSAASECRSQRLMDGIAAILHSEVVLGNRQSLDFGVIAAVADRATNAVKECK